MESNPHDLEEVKSPPWDFVLVKAIQRQPKNNEYFSYSASGIHLFKNPITGKVNGKPYFTDTFQLPKGDVYVLPDGINQCAILLNDGEIRRVKKEVEKVEKLYLTPATKLNPLSSEERLNYYKEVYVSFETWYHDKGVDLPDFKTKPVVVYSTLTTRKDIDGEDYVVFLYDENGLDLPGSDRSERKTKKQEYEELFMRIFEDPKANPVEVKRVLNDKQRWINPSQYLHSRRREMGISVDDLKKKPGFTWIDPKGTAKD